MLVFFGCIFMWILQWLDVGWDSTNKSVILKRHTETMCLLQKNSLVMWSKFTM